MTSREKVEEILKLLKSQGGHWLRRCNVIEQALTEARLEGAKMMQEKAACELEQAFAECDTYNLLHGAARIRALNPSEVIK